MLPHITVIIAHAHPQFSLILQHIIRSQATLRLLAVTSSVAELLQLIALHLPDIVIADMGLPGMDALALASQVPATCKAPRMLLSWHHHQAHLVNGAVAGGAAALVAQEAPPMHYGVAIRQVMRGEPYYCDHTTRLIQAPGAGYAGATLPRGLPAKYLLVLYCQSLGYNIKETALATGLTEHTVNTYRKRCKKLLGVGAVGSLMRTLDMRP